MTKFRQGYIRRRILMRLYFDGTCTVKQMAVDFEVYPSSVSRALHALIKRGWVTDVRTLTEEGKEEAQKVIGEVPIKLLETLEAIKRKEAREKQLQSMIKE